MKIQLRTEINDWKIRHVTDDCPVPEGICVSVDMDSNTEWCPFMAMSECATYCMFEIEGGKE